jgi:hypothetical protein
MLEEIVSPHCTAANVSPIKDLFRLLDLQLAGREVYVQDLSVISKVHVLSP